MIMWQGWGAALIVLATLLALSRTRWAPDMVLFCALVACVAIGALPAERALAGFGSPALLSIAVLTVVAAGLRYSGALYVVLALLLGPPNPAHRALARLMFPLASISAFLNNTPLVALLLPEVCDWARRHGVASSRFLIPLSYATILGGMCTLIGTSTNLLVSGLVVQSGLPALDFWGPSALGIPVAVVGLGYLWLLGPRLLPDRGNEGDAFRDVQAFTTELVVPSESPLVGKALSQVRFQQRVGIQPAEIIRGETVLPAPMPQEMLRAGDRLVFAGPAAAMLRLHHVDGMQTATSRVFRREQAQDRRMLVDVVLTQRCPLLGARIGEGHFRATYGGAVLAVSRGGERLTAANPEAWVFHAGDVLLVEARPSFLELQRDHQEFTILAHRDDSRPRHPWQAWFGGAVALGLLVAVVVLRLPILTAALMAAAALLLARILDARQVRNAIDLPVLLALGASFGLGEALRHTGVAAALGNLVAQAGSAHMALALVWLITTLLSQLVTNAAAAALTLPVALTVAQSLGAAPHAFIYTVMLAASCCFSTPIGYQTNLMVYGPGNYRFSDFLRIGLPLDLLCGVVIVGLAPLIWPL